MIARLDSLTPVAEECVRRARARGVGVVWRAQSRRGVAVVVTGGRAEEVSRLETSGIGVHVATEEGRTALGSVDGLEPEPVLDLLERTAELALRAEALGVPPAPGAGARPTRARAVPQGIGTLASVDPSRAIGVLVDLEREVAAANPGVDVRLGFHAELDAWRILREDGTDVLFAVPRCVLRASLGAGGPRGRHLVSAHAAAPLPSALDDPEWLARFLRRARGAARLAAALPDAPPFPAGSHPMLIDYALAKGLAHEAFGHASEGDGFRTSVLARDGRFRSGEAVGASHVSVIDEPIPGDHAWQPFSADGEPRLPVVIVDRGRLRDALCDRWSATWGGVPALGSGRAESYRNAPLPRMTNIRIESEHPLPAAGSFEEYGPEEVRDLAASSGLFRRHRRVAFLSGYAGGQVNPATGDFVFQCKAIWSLGEDGVSLHRPAIFSGSMFGALGAIREAYGPLLLDAIGTCGKWGQSVPSSGGSHWFLALDPDPSVRLGGR